MPHPQQPTGLQQQQHQILCLPNETLSPEQSLSPLSFLLRLFLSLLGPTLPEQQGYFMEEKTPLSKCYSWSAKFLKPLSQGNPDFRQVKHANAYQRHFLGFATCGLCQSSLPRRVISSCFRKTWTCHLLLYKLLCFLGSFRIRMDSFLTQVIKKQTN